MADFETRFGGMAQWCGRDGLEKLRAAHVAVIGLGGVGTWAAEALARSGVGRLTLVDADEICASNINRQLHALTNTVGRPKVEVMAERVRAIHPDCQVTARQCFFRATGAGDLLDGGLDWVCDAIDGATDKAALLAACVARGLPVISSGAAGGRREATAIRIADLACVTHDRLLAEVRRRLRRESGRAADGSLLGIDCVYSAETPCPAQIDGPAEPGGRLNCNGGLGSATFVTGSFGFAAAGWIVRKISGV